MADTTPIERIYDIHGLSERIGVPITSIRRWRDEGKGPAAVRQGRGLRWRESTVRAWEDRLEAADAAALAARRAAV